jgi:peptide/nickel transport system permease protein
MSANAQPRDVRKSRFFAIVLGLVSRPSGAIGVFFIISNVVIAIISPWIAPYDFRAVSVVSILEPPSWQHWLGTDQLGRDVLTRTLMGGRQALIVTMTATPLAVLWGGVLGIYAGLVAGRFDEILMRIVDAFLSLPWILKMLLIIVMFGSGLFVLIPTLAFFYGIPVIRIARAATHSIVARDYISAARARGQSRFWIIR